MVMKTFDDWAVYADTVKENVSALDVGHALGLDIRKGRCKCPIHNGSDYNCSLSKTKPFYHCFVCGAKGDVIGLVRAIMDMPFPDALRWFNSTFNLQMDIDSSKDEKRLKKAKNALKRKAEQRRFTEHIEKLDYDLYLAVCTAYDRFEKQRDDNRPKRYSEDWNKPFAESFELLPELKENMEYFAIQSTVIKT